MPSQIRPLIIIIRPRVCVYSFLFPIENFLYFYPNFYILVFISFYSYFYNFMYYWFMSYWFMSYYHLSHYNLFITFFFLLYPFQFIFLCQNLKMPSQTRPLMIIIRPWVCLYSFLFPIETCLILLSYCFYLLVFILFIYILFYLYVNYVLFNFVKTNQNDARLKEMGGRRHRPPPTKA